MFGWRKGVDGLTGKESNAVDLKKPDGDRVFVDATAPDCGAADPAHGLDATTSKLFGLKAPTGAPQFVIYETNTIQQSFNTSTPLNGLDS